MTCVGLEGDGFAPASHPQQEQRHPQIHEGSRHRHREAEPDLFERFRMDKSRQGGHRDAHRREHDQRAFHATGKIFRLAVTVGVVLVGRFRRHGQHCQRHHATDQIDDRFDRIGQQPNRAGDKIGHRLQPDRDDRRRDGQPGKPREGLAAHTECEVAATDVAPAQRDLPVWGCIVCP